MQSFFAAIVGLALVWSLAACAAPPPGPRHAWRLAGGGHAGYADLMVDGRDNPEGVAGGGRIELLGSVRPLEIGGRLLATAIHAERSSATFDLEVDASELCIEGVVRAPWPSRQGGVVPWAEVFGGAGYYHVDVRARGAGSFGESDDDLGWTAGAGLGADVPLDDFAALSVGAEVRWSRYDADLLGDVDELNVLGTFTVVHRF